MPCLTAEQFQDWQQFYDQDPWGGERDDWRAMASEMRQRDPETDVTMNYPYWQIDDEREAIRETLEKKRRSMTDEDIAAVFKTSREAYLKDKKRG